MIIANNGTFTNLGKRNKNIVFCFQKNYNIMNKYSQRMCMFQSFYILFCIILSPMNMNVYFYRLIMSSKYSVLILTLHQNMLEICRLVESTFKS